MLLLFFVIIAAGCAAIDVPVLRRRGMRRDRLAGVIFWALGLGAVICSLYNIQVPSPLYLVKLIYTPVNLLFESLFY